MEDSIYQEEKKPKAEITTVYDTTKAEIDQSVATAKRYPRSIATFRQDAMTMATIDPEIAASCFYKIPRGGKSIEGPSVRLAEIVASAWGNLRFGARIIGRDSKFVTAQGVAHDTQKNVYVTKEVKRRITDKHGTTFNDDMIAVTENAACSIAFRNALFAAVPFTYTKQIYEMAKKTAIGDAKSLKDRRHTMIEAFSKMGVGLDQILLLVEKNGVEDIGLGEIETLLGVFTAVKDGETTIEEAFPPPPKKEAPKAAEAAKAAPMPPSEQLAQAAETATAALAPEAPAAKPKEGAALTPLQLFNTLYTRVKKQVSKEKADTVMSQFGHAGAFPSKIPLEDLEQMIHEYRLILGEA